MKNLFCTVYPVLALRNTLAGALILSVLQVRQNRPELTSLSSHSYWVVKTDSKGWDGPVVRTRCYSSRELKLDPLNPYMVVQNCLSLQLQGVWLLWLSSLHSCALTNRHIHSQKNNKINHLFKRAEFEFSPFESCLQGFHSLTLWEDSDTGWYDEGSSILTASQGLCPPEEGISRVRLSLQCIPHASSRCRAVRLHEWVNLHYVLLDMALMGDGQS